MASRGDPSSTLTIAVGPASGSVPVQELTTFGTVSVKSNFNDGDDVSFDALGRSSEAPFIDELATDVWMTGPIIQRFRLTSVNQSWDADGGDVLSCTAVSYKRLLKARHVGPGGLEFAGVDQGDIVWEFWQHTQARVGGNLGVTKGLSITGVERDRTYVEGDNLGDLAANLQNVIDGLWWEVDAAKVYSARLPDSFVLQPQPVEVGVNARTLQRKSAADRFANVVFADADDSATTPVWVEASGLASDPRGRWERAFGWPTVTEQTTLQEHAEGALQESSTPLTSWSIELDPSRWLHDSLYLPGDLIVLVVPPSTAAPIGAGGGRVVVQVSEMSVGISADGAVVPQLACIETSQTPP